MFFDEVANPGQIATECSDVSGEKGAVWGRFHTSESVASGVGSEVMADN